MARLLILNGPNLNLLGTREPGLYGEETLDVINGRLVALASELAHEALLFQSNAEHALIERIHSARSQQVEFIVFNPGGFTHTSVALRDALLAVAIPFIEVHLSNTYAREAFRRHSYFSDIAVGSVVGLGAMGYELALRAAASRLTKQGT